MGLKNFSLDQYPMVLVPDMKNITTFTDEMLFVIAL